MECWTSWIARQSFQIDGSNGGVFGVRCAAIRSCFCVHFIQSPSISFYFRHMQFELNLYDINIWTFHAVYQLWCKHSQTQTSNIGQSFRWHGISPLKTFGQAYNWMQTTQQLLHKSIRFEWNCAVFLAFFRCNYSLISTFLVK